jgi:hypothetical protein
VAAAQRRGGDREHGETGGHGAADLSGKTGELAIGGREAANARRRGGVPYRKFRRTILGPKWPPRPASAGVHTPITSRRPWTKGRFSAFRRASASSRGRARFFVHTTSPTSTAVPSVLSATMSTLKGVRSVPGPHQDRASPQCCGTLLTQWTHGRSARASAFAIPAVETPSCRATSAKASPSWVRVSQGRAGRDRRRALPLYLRFGLPKEKWYRTPVMG